jgi:hypothetical protein
MKVAVATPYRETTPQVLVDRSLELYRRLTFENKCRLAYKNTYGYARDYATNAQARNDIVDVLLQDDTITHVLWVDVDIVNYPPDLIERLAEYEASYQVCAPLVLLEGVCLYYDVGGFVQDGKFAKHEFPYFDAFRELESVGSCYLIPRSVYVAGARYEASKDFTEHLSVMHKARELGARIGVRPSLIAWHAMLPNYGARWQIGV